MIRGTAFVFALAALSCAAVTVAEVRPAQADPKPALSRFAPADEYFGQLKLSILGIRNQLHDIGLAYDYNPDNANADFGKTVMVEESLRDWERKYPLDPDIARHIYLLSHLYQKFTLVEAHVKALRTEAWLVSKYPRTWYAKDERIRIAYRTSHPEQVASKPMAGATPFTRPAQLNAIAPIVNGAP
jgi:hypothetical protein